MRRGCETRMGRFDRQRQKAQHKHERHSGQHKQGKVQREGVVRDGQAAHHQRRQGSLQGLHRKRSKLRQCMAR